MCPAREDQVPSSLCGTRKIPSADAGLTHRPDGLPGQSAREGLGGGEGVVRR